MLGGRLRRGLGDVTVEQVEAAGVAQFFDLGEELGGADGGVLFPASAQVLTVGADEGGPVLRCADQALRFADPGVAFDGVEAEVEPAGAFEQADAFVEQVVDLLPSLPGLCHRCQRFATCNVSGRARRTASA